MQPKRCTFKHVFIFLNIFFITQKTNAQIPDTNYVDTITMANVDTSTSETYDDDNEEYDTTVKHIYDTSQYFFNWKQNINDPYTTEKIAQRHLIDDDTKQLKSEDAFWYVPAAEKLETRLKNDPKFRDSLMNARNHELHDENDIGFLQQPWFNTLLWIIIITIFVGAIIYFLSQQKISLFSRESTSPEDETNEEHGDIFHLPYTKLILQAEKEKNYRIAIRLMFLQIIKLLSETNNIHYQPNYTNLHYLQQLSQTKYYNEFFKVMHNYEYVWYGKFDISTDNYNTIKNDFLKLQNKII
ncbi:MAG: hypothetical protein ABJA35_02675 [Parafilimonas sp.]